jgi:hypothetical protein
MKLLSFREISLDTLRTLRRFPFIVATSLLGVISALILIDYEGPPGTSILFNIVYAAIPGILLLLALTLTAEKRRWNTRVTLGTQLAGIIALSAYASTLPSLLIDTPAADLVRLMTVTIAMTFLTAYAPFAMEGSINGFWHYNKVLVFRVLLAFLYSTVLYIGLILALLAINNLFSIDIQPKRYGELAVFIYGFINTMIFLRGIPEDLESLDGITEYPKGLKIFVQYILLPLSTVYLIIIYAYAAKILFMWDWPQGWISRMILGYSVTGFLSLLFLYPVHTKEENGWMRTVFRSFFISMIPLLVLFPLALFRRISQYGMTENRYVAVMIAVWMSLIIIYFIFSRKKNIKLIPLTMFILSLLMIAGPWNMFAVSEQSQCRRLEGILTQAGILTGGKIHATVTPVSAEEKKNISSIVTYLHDLHGYGTIRPWFTEDLHQTDNGMIKDLPPDRVVKKFGIEYVNIWQGVMSNTMMIIVEQDALLDIEGYQSFIRAQFIDENTKEHTYPGMNFSYRVSRGLDSLMMFSGSVQHADTVLIDLHAFAVRMRQEFGDSHLGSIPQEKMTLTGNGKNVKIKLFFKSLQTHSTDGKIRVTSCAFDIAYSKGNPE